MTEPGIPGSAIRKRIMAVIPGYTMHESGFWFRIADTTGPYVYDGTQMILMSDAVVNEMDGSIYDSGIKANQIAVAIMPAVAGKRNYITGFEITGSGATLGSVVTATLDGVRPAPVRYAVAAPSGILASIAPLVVQFRPPIPATAANTAISLTLPALGLGNQNASVVLHGFVTSE